MGMPGVIDSLIAAGFWAIGKGITDSLADPLQKVIEDTSAFFSKERNFEFEIKNLLRILNSDASKEELGRLIKGERLIDGDALALHFAIYGMEGIDYPENEKLDLAKEIIAEIRVRFEDNLLYSRDADKVLAGYMKIFRENSRLEHESICEEINLLRKEIQSIQVKKVTLLDLPAKAENFTARKDDVKYLVKNLVPGKVIALYGPGGMGKSAIAYQAIHELTDSGDRMPDLFPDGVLWHNFYVQEKAEQALDYIARSLGEVPDKGAYDAAKLALSGKRVLILLDGTETCDNLGQVLGLLGNCGVIITTRKRKDAGGDLRRIESFDADDSKRLFKKIVKMTDTSEDDSILTICSTIGQFPLAIRLAAKYLVGSGETIDEYLTWLKESPLEALDQGERRLESVNVLLQKSIDQVSEESRRLLSVVGILTLNPFSREAVQAAMRDINIRKPLTELVDYAILNRVDERYVVTHSLIHTYISRFLIPVDESISLLVDYYSSFIETCNAKEKPGIELLHPERLHILKIFDICSEKSQWKNIDKLVWEFIKYLDLQGFGKEQISVLNKGLEASKLLNDKHNEGSYLGNLGTTYGSLSQFEKAIEYLEQGLAISREIGDRRGEGIQLGNLGIAYRSLGQFDKAIEYHEQALAISREIGHREGEGNQLGSLGIAYWSLGQFEKAIEYYEQGLEILISIKSPNAEIVKKWLDELKIK